jgi:hypothetical protein
MNAAHAIAILILLLPAVMRAREPRGSPAVRRTAVARTIGGGSAVHTTGA